MACRRTRLGGFTVEVRESGAVRAAMNAGDVHGDDVVDCAPARKNIPLPVYLQSSLQLLQRCPRASFTSLHSVSYLTMASSALKPSGLAGAFRGTLRAPTHRVSCVAPAARMSIPCLAPYNGLTYSSTVHTLLVERRTCPRTVQEEHGLPTEKAMEDRRCVRAPRSKCCRNAQVAEEDETQYRCF